MTSYEFEKAAKNAVSDELKALGVDVTLSELQLVWLSYTLGNIKCTIYSPKMDKKYAEVTFNKEKEQIYVDIYEKLVNKCLEKTDFNFDAGVVAS